MLVERYPPMSLFALVPKLLCDFEPVLRQLDTLLEDDELIQRLKADLARRAPNSLSRGRPSTPVEVILRLLVVKRLYDWSYEEVERLVSDRHGAGANADATLVPARLSLPRRD